MKKVSTFLVLILILSFLTACQKTPDEQFVMKKDTERMIEQAAAQENGTPISALGIPDERYTYETSDTSGTVRIYADAAIILPDVERLPIVHVGMGKFTERDGRLTMPFCVNIAHAAADGYHTSMFINELQKQLDTITLKEL